MVSVAEGTIALELEDRPPLAKRNRFSMAALHLPCEANNAQTQHARYPGQEGMMGH
jgi:hypothetical protein